jgi:hypothetical protein
VTDGRGAHEYQETTLLGSLTDILLRVPFTSFRQPHGPFPYTEDNIIDIEKDDDTTFEHHTYFLWYCSESSEFVNSYCHRSGDRLRPYNLVRFLESRRAFHKQRLI